jgi:hypothetical protein
VNFLNNQTKNAFLRRLAAEALGKIGRSSTIIVQALADSLVDKDEKLTTQAAISLGEIGPGARDAVSALAGALRNPTASGALRKEAAHALGEIARDPDTAIRALCWRLTRSGADHGTALEIADALPKFGFEGRVSLSTLSSLLKDPETNPELYGHVLSAYAAICSQVTNNIHLLHWWELLTYLGQLKSVERALVSNSLNDTQQAVVAIHITIRMIQEEAATRKSLKIGGLVACLVSAWSLLALMWWILSGWHPKVVISIIRVLDKVKLEGVVLKVIRIETIALGRLVGYILLPRCFARRAVFYKRLRNK